MNPCNCCYRPFLSICRKQALQENWDLILGVTRLFRKKSMIQKAIVQWYNKNKGFGLAKLENGTDIFLHWKNITIPYAKFNPGDMIALEVYEGEKGPVGKRIKKWED